MDSWTLTWSKLLEISATTSLIIPELSGVYRLSYQSSDGNIYVFYVGQADNLRQRINEHTSNSETNLCIKRMLLNFKCFVRYARVDNPNVRDGAERFLYGHYSPSCNSIEPSGSRLVINLENTR